MKTGISVGLNKGYIVPKIERKAMKDKLNKFEKNGRPSRRKGRLGKRTKFVRDVISEIAGYTPYERRIREMIRIGTAQKAKKALIFAKKRLGTTRRGKAKREAMSISIMEEKK